MCACMCACVCVHMKVIEGRRRESNYSQTLNKKNSLLYHQSPYHITLKELVVWLLFQTISAHGVLYLLTHACSRDCGLLVFHSQ